MKVYIIHNGIKKYVKDYSFSKEGYAYAHYTPKQEESINVPQTDAERLSKVFNCLIEK